MRNSGDLINSQAPSEMGDKGFIPAMHLRRRSYLFGNIPQNTRILSCRSLLTIISALLLCSATAQNFTTKLSATTIGKNGNVEVTYEVENGNKVDNFQPPAFKDWVVIGGPNNSSFASSINGKVSKRTSISYYLQPKHTGSLPVEGARALVDGKLMTSNNALVEVLNKNVEETPQNNNADPLSGILDDPFFDRGQQQAAEQLDASQILRPNEDTIKKIRDNLMLKVAVNKTSCYEGEAIMATYKLYARVEVEGSFLKRPSFSGFSAFDMEGENMRYTIEVLNGKSWKVYTIRKVQLYPLQSGKLSLDPVALDCKVRFIRQEAMSGGTYDAYDPGSFVTVDHTVKTPAIKIDVAPLPTEGRPADFSGAVGDFVIHASLDDAVPGKDDAATLTVKITGSGNFPMVHAPVVAWPADVEAYDPSEKENLIKSIIPISGDKSFEYVFVCHRPGDITLPVIQFSYFDLKLKRYKTIRTGPIPLKVGATSKRPKDKYDDESNWPLIFVSIAKYILPTIAIGLVLYVIFGLLKKKKKQQQDDEQHAMNEAWERMVRETSDQKGIQETDETTKESSDTSGDDSRFMPAEPAPVEVTVPDPDTPVLRNAYEVLWSPGNETFYKALKLDLMNALAKAAGKQEANRTAILLALHLKGTDAEVLEQIGTLLDECDAAIYSPLIVSTDRSQLLEEAKALLLSIKH